MGGGDSQRQLTKKLGRGHRWVGRRDNRQLALFDICSSLLPPLLKSAVHSIMNSRNEFFFLARDPRHRRSATSSFSRSSPKNTAKVRWGENFDRPPASRFEPGSNNKQSGRHGGGGGGRKRWMISVDGRKRQCNNVVKEEKENNLPIEKNKKRRGGLS